MVTDVHAHVIAPELLRGPRGAEPWRPLLRDGSGRSTSGRPEIELEGRNVASFLHDPASLEDLLAAQRARDIEHTVLSPWVPLLFAEAEVPEAARRLALQNEGLARLREQRPESVSVLGAVPVQDPALAAKELHGLIEAGFAGIEIPSSVGGRYLGDPSFEPLWVAAEETQALVFVHPTTRGFEAPVFAEHYLWNLVGNPFETTIAAAHLVMSGTLERHPDLRVVLAHGGGAILSLRGRLRHGQRTVPEAGRWLAQPADVTLGRFMFDTVTHDPLALRALVEAVGRDQVLLGSDHPFDMGDPDPIATVRAARLGPDAERAILHGNAERLLAAGVAR
jgi:aminocarboxymuconate-semialdehyde decarboxylase